MDVAPGEAYPTGMNEPTDIHVRLSGPLGEFVISNIGEDAPYQDANEYVRDLVRREMERVETGRFESLKAELQRAFATPDDQYVTVTAEDVIARNRVRRQA
jgi:antitoxin ParD1/3/4